MKKMLIIDAAMRQESRTRTLLHAFLEGLQPDVFRIAHLKLDELRPQPLNEVTLYLRTRLVNEKHYDDPMFTLARQFSEADVIVFAAPYWDMSFPAVLKAYIENICVEGITFRTSETGLQGLCRCEQAFLLTTRGGFTETGSQDDQALPYLNAIGRLTGYGDVKVIAASCLDIAGMDHEGLLADACDQAREAGEELSCRMNPRTMV